MALHKNNSRAADRVKIKRYHAQGFDNEQIAAKLSITPSHIAYVLDEYEDALLQNVEKAQSKIDKQNIQMRVDRETANFREAEALARRQDPNVPNVDVAAIKAELRAELLAEMRAEQAIAKKDIEDEAEVEEEEEVEEKKPRRSHRRKTAA